MSDFLFKKKVYYHDTDCGGVVYYANYLKFFEEARTEHLLHNGIDLKRLSEEGILFAVADAEIEYRTPARYGDELAILSRVEKIRGASIYFYHNINRVNALVLIAECRTRLVSIGLNFKPISLPADIKKLL